MNIRNLISTAALARKLDVPITRLNRVLLASGIAPDLTPSPKMRLFSADKVDAIRALIGGDQ